jgi:hypothetical protein
LPVEKELRREKRGDGAMLDWLKAYTKVQ